MVERLIELIRSKDMRDKIRKRGFTFSDLELVKLAYTLSRTYDERIKNLSDLFCYVKDEKAKAIIAEFLEREKQELDFLVSRTKNTFYDVVVFERPGTDGSHYAFKTYEESLSFIKDYVNACRKEEYLNEDFNIRYEISKRYFKSYDMRDFDFQEDVLICCEFGYGGVMKKTTVYNEKAFRRFCGGRHSRRRTSAETKIVYLNIRYPRCYKKYDLISYLDYYGEIQYAVFLFHHTAKDSCDYCISLNAEYFGDEDGFKEYWNAHEHIDAAESERADAGALPRAKKELYYKLVEYIKSESGKK
jgi:hypothetical protein